MPLLQYLIACDDGSMCIVHRTSINCKDRAKLPTGKKVSFMWPEDEDSPDRQEYVGEIIESSVKEKILQLVKQRKIREIEAENRRKERLEKGAKAKQRKCKDDERKEADEKEKNTKFKQGRKENREETAEKKKYDDNGASCSRKRKTSLKTMSPVAAKRKCNVDMARAIFKELNMIEDDENDDGSHSEKSCASPTEIQDEEDPQEKDEDDVSTTEASVDDYYADDILTENIEAAAVQEKKDSEKMALLLADQRTKKSNVGHLEELRKTLSKAQDLVNVLLSQNAFDDNAGAAGLSKKMVTEEIILSNDANHDGTRERQRSFSPELHFSMQESHSSSTLAKTFEKLSTSKSAVKGQTHSARAPPVKSPVKSVASELLEEDDNSWTLRFTKEEENKVIEIMPGTGIYVSKIELTNIDRKAKCQTQMARQLLEAIYTREALKTCTLCGKKPRGLGKEYNAARPALHQEAKTVLLEYVQQTANKLKWPRVADQLIMQSLRAKLNETKDAAKLNKN